MAANTLNRNQRNNLNVVRREFKDALQNNNSLAIDDAFKKLIRLNISPKQKCQRISIANILKENCKTPQAWDDISKALGILDRYAANLLKPKEERPNGWDAIMVKNDIFAKRIEPIVGTRQILTEIGYKYRDDEYIRLKVEPSSDHLLWLRADLKIAKIELDLYRNKSHPYPERLNELVCSEARIEQDPAKQKTYVDESTPPVIAEPNVAVNASPRSSSAASSTSDVRTSSSLSMASSTSDTEAATLKSLTTQNQQIALEKGLKPVDGGALTSVPASPDGRVLNEPSIAPPTYEQSTPPYVDTVDGRVVSEPVWKKQSDTTGTPISRAQTTPTQARAGSYDAYPQKPINDRDPGQLPSSSAPHPPPYNHPPPSLPSPHGPPYNHPPPSLPSPHGPPYNHPPPSLPSPHAPPYKHTPPAPSSLHVYPNLQEEFYDAPSGPPVKTERKHHHHEEKPKAEATGKKPQGFFGRMRSMFGFGSSEVEPGQEVEEVRPAEQPGSEWTISMKYLKQIGKEPDLEKRLEKLDVIIPFLELEVKDHEKKIEEIILQDAHYMKNDDYKFLTERKDHLRRELILMSRNRSDIQPFTRRGGSGDDSVRRQEGPVRKERSQEQPPRPSNNARPLNKNDKWECKHCTFHNSMDLNVCSACSKTADVKDKVKLEVAEPEDGYVTPTEVPINAQQAASGDMVFGNASFNNAVFSSAAPASAVLSSAVSTYDAVHDSVTPSQIENEETNVNQLLDWMTTADGLGYTVQQFEFALNACAQSQVGPIDWLDTNWTIMVEILESDLEKSLALDDSFYGRYSRREVEQALAASVDVKDALELCRSTRRGLVDSLIECYYHIPRTDIVKAVVENEGEELIIYQKLNARVLRSLLEEIPQILDEELLDDQQLYQLVADERREHRQVALMLERGITYPVADRVVNIIGNNLLNTEDYDLPPTFDEIVEAAKSSQFVDGALSYLQRECQLCFAYHPESRFVCMFICSCRMCTGCFIRHFEQRVRNFPASRFNCPICPKPDIMAEAHRDETDVHFQMLDNVLKDQLKPADYECFQQKLLEWNCLVNPNFRWCQTDTCKNGFLVEPEAVARQLRVTCPKCRSSICFQCKKQWENAHTDRTCDEFADWQEQNHPDVLAMETLLQENGIVCPKCKSRFELARGGCLHFKCSQDFCRHEFCAGCNLPISKNCRKYPECATKGLHAHHPRYCLYSMRDMNCEELRGLLEDGGVELRIEERRAEGNHCRVMEQKEREADLVDEECGREIYGTTGLCVLHYKEYLVNLVNRHKIDPVVIMDAGQLRGHLKENHIVIPNYAVGTSDAIILQNLRQLVQGSIALQYNQ